MNIITRTATFLRHSLDPTHVPLAYVGGWLGQRNLGDQALLHGIRRTFDRFSVWHYDGSRSMTALLRNVRRTHAGVFGGGTLINRAPEYRDLAKKFQGIVGHLAIFGTGVADPDFWTGRGDFKHDLAAWKPILNACAYVGVRGPRSAELLGDAGVERVRIVGDPVITFARNPAQEHRPRTLGLNVGYNHGHQWGDENALQQEVCSLAKLARRDGWVVKWLVVFPADLPITMRAAQESGTSEHVVCAYERPEPYLAEVETLTAFVGMKLHSTILALCAHVPSLMLEYDPKCLDFMMSIGREDALVRTDRFKADEAWSRVKDWLNHRNQLSEEIRTAIGKLRDFHLSEARSLSAQLHAIGSDSKPR